MSERYWITGVQLGMLKAMLQMPSQPSALVDEIIEKQFIGNFHTDKDKDRFIEQIKKVK